jgi:hypothetical protein
VLSNFTIFPFERSGKTTQNSSLRAVASTEQSNEMTVQSPAKPWILTPDIRINFEETITNVLPEGENVTSSQVKAGSNTDQQKFPKAFSKTTLNDVELGQNRKADLKS